MTTYVPKDVQDGLEAARMAGLKKTSRVRVQVGDDLYPVLKLWKTGFAVEADTTPQLRGLVADRSGTASVSVPDRGLGSGRRRDAL
jgi:hypothetical protein